MWLSSPKRRVRARRHALAPMLHKITRCTLHVAAAHDAFYCVGCVAVCVCVCLCASCTQRRWCDFFLVCCIASRCIVVDRGDARRPPHAPRWHPFSFSHAPLYNCSGCARRGRTLFLCCAHKQRGTCNRKPRIRPTRGYPVVHKRGDKKSSCMYVLCFVRLWARATIRMCMFSKRNSDGTIIERVWGPCVYGGNSTTTSFCERFTTRCRHIVDI